MTPIGATQNVLTLITRFGLLLLRQIALE